MIYGIDIKTPTVAREFVRSNPVFKKSVLARMIQWDSSSFTEWLKGNRPIPHYKLDILLEILKKYGCREC